MPNSQYRTQRTKAEQVVLEAQRLLAEYLPPDSGISDRECINQLLGLLDGPLGQEVAFEIRNEGPGQAAPGGLAGSPAQELGRQGVH